MLRVIVLAVLLLAIVSLLPLSKSNQIINIAADLGNEGASFSHFWKSTGLCPPDPKSKIYEFMSSEEEKINLALIGSLPHKGIAQVRIHWLYNLITFEYYAELERVNYNYINLDKLLSYLISYNLRPGFELMGYPMNEDWTDEKNKDFLRKFNQENWKQFTQDLVTHCIHLFGAEEVSKWNFETWNEPDLKNYNILNFNQSGYLSYVLGTAEGLLLAFQSSSTNTSNSTIPTSIKSPQDTPSFNARPSKEKLRIPELIGPAGLFHNRQHHPLCWALLELCATSKCPIKRLSFHRKGNGSAGGVLEGTQELLNTLYNEYPETERLEILNDEADILVGWSRNESWRGDVRYASMVVQVIAGFWKLQVNGTARVALISNDNAFLNYHPFYFTQRTLFARFQMNHTSPPHNQFIPKPVYSVMALLARVGNTSLPFNLTESNLTVLATRRGRREASFLVTNIREDDSASEITKEINIILRGLDEGENWWYAVYILDNFLTNPFEVWRKEGEQVFPGKITRRLMRDVAEPARVRGPSPVVVGAGSLRLGFELGETSVVLVQICARIDRSPGRVRELRAVNITRNEVLITWSDKSVRTRCIRSYEVEFHPRCGWSDGFRRVNSQDTMFLSYQYAPAGNESCEATIGRYRVRAVDFWNRKGRYSKVVTFPSS